LSTYGSTFRGNREIPFVFGTGVPKIVLGSLRT
jgi:hypothetical protein